MQSTMHLSAQSALMGSQCAIPSSNSMKEHATSPNKVWSLPNTTSHSNALNNTNFSQQTPKEMYFKTSLLEIDLHHMVWGASIYSRLLSPISSTILSKWFEFLLQAHYHVRGPITYWDWREKLYLDGIGWFQPCKGWIQVGGSLLYISPNHVG